MARGRLISRTLGSSRKFAALLKQAGKLGEFAQVLFPLLVSTSDDFGRQSGDAFTVKHAVFPTSPRHEEEFTAALTAMHHVGLIRWYEAEGGQVIQIVGFDVHQPNLHKRADCSKFPDFPGTSGISGLTKLNLTELNSIQEKGRKEKAPLTRRATDPVPEPFGVFWLAYPRKKSRSTAERAWRKLAPSPDLAQRILDAIAAQRNSPQWLDQEGKFIPYPATWLNGRRWEDVESPPPVAVKADWCAHEPRCYSPSWHAVVVAREQGEAV